MRNRLQAIEPKSGGIMMRRSRAVKCDQVTEVCVVIPVPVFEPTTTGDSRAIQNLPWAASNRAKLT